MTEKRSNKGKTRWYPRETKQFRHGEYECIVRFGNVGYFRETTYWDGIGYIVSMPHSTVVKWRGLTKKEYVRLTQDTA